MGCALVLNLDSQSADAVRRLWSRLSTIAPQDHLWSAGVAPHITLGIFDHVDEADVPSVLAPIVATTAAFSVRLSGIGLFPGPGHVLYLVPSANDRLTACQANLHKRATALGWKGWDTYAPGAWVPHCTLASELAPSLLLPALEQVMADWQPIEGSLQELAAYKLQPPAPLYREQLLPT